MDSIMFLEITGGDRSITAPWHRALEWLFSRMCPHVDLQITMICATISTIRKRTLQWLLSRVCAQVNAENALRYCRIGTSFIGTFERFFASVRANVNLAIKGVDPVKE